nr:MAG TPA: hypothetical protein [Caudoviricetes sp.]
MNLGGTNFKKPPVDLSQWPGSGLTLQIQFNSNIL